MRAGRERQARARFIYILNIGTTVAFSLFIVRVVVRHMNGTQRRDKVLRDYNFTVMAHHG